VSVRAGGRTVPEPPPLLSASVGLPRWPPPLVGEPRRFVASPDEPPCAGGVGDGRCPGRVVDGCCPDPFGDVPRRFVASPDEPPCAGGVGDGRCPGRVVDGCCPDPSGDVPRRFVASPEEPLRPVFPPGCPCCELPAGFGCEVGGGVGLASCCCCDDAYAAANSSRSKTENHRAAKVAVVRPVITSPLENSSVYRK